MKKLKFFIALVFMSGFLFFLNKPTFAADGELLALNSNRLGKYSNYQIYFYDPDALNCIPRNGSGGSGGHKAVTLSGSSRIEKIWNYIVDLGISGLSDSAEAISGVLGNMSTETGGTFNPFVQNSSGCTGLIQWCKGSWNNGFFSYMSNLGLDEHYYRGSEPDIDESIIDEGIETELDFLFKDGSGGVTANKYIANLGVPSIQDGTSGARAYADLFLVTVENAYGGGDTLEDSGVASIAGYSTYQAAGSRRDRAETIYDMYSGWEDDDSDEDEGEETEETKDDDGMEYCDEDEEEDDDSDSPEAGNLVDFVKKWAWPNYEKGKTEQMPAYEEYMSTEATYKGACSGNDCGAFVANIIKASGWDTSYPQCSTSCQKSWLPQHWTQVSSDSLKLGDVGVKNTGHHVILYVGSISGFNSNTASASQCDRAPMAGADRDLSKYTWYRK